MPARHRAVADHGDDVAVALAAIARDGKAKRGGDRGRRRARRRTDRTRSRAPGETGEAPALAQSADAVAPAGRGSCADRPGGRRPRSARRCGVSKHVVQRDRELDDAEAGAQMAARDRHRADGLGAQFVRDLTQLAGRARAEIGWEARSGREAGSAGPSGSFGWPFSAVGGSTHARDAFSTDARAGNRASRAEFRRGVPSRDKERVRSRLTGAGAIWPLARWRTARQA